MRARIARQFLLAVAAVATGPALACGFEAPGTVMLGALNFVYPDALHVSTAVWQAQQRGLLPPERSVPQGTTPEARARAGQAALWDALRVLSSVRERLAGTAVEAPPLAIVLLPAALWARIEPRAGEWRLQMHVSGPVSGDVVWVTEVAVLRAWTQQHLPAADLFVQGLVRDYGDESSRQAWRRTFSAAESPSPTQSHTP